MKPMDKDSRAGAIRLAAAIKKVVGSIQETLGRAIGDRNMEAEGKAKKVAGTAEQTMGSVKDATREINGQQ
jgi:uncharacterized protein YjbJ (UPF0337 family)